MAVDKFSLFESAITRRGRQWRWAISDQSGNLAMVGTERTTAEAGYRAARAFFQLLLTAPYRSQSDLVFGLERSHTKERAALAGGPVRSLIDSGQKPGVGKTSPGNEND
jgi:hypothetical protein